MHILRSIILSIFLLNNISSFGQITNAQKRITIDVKIDTEYSGKSIWGYSVGATLTNVSNDTLFYLTMSCSWQDLYATNRNDYFIMPPLCDKNIPMIATILPHEKILKTFFMDSHTKSIMPGSVNLKIGFHFIPIKINENLFDKSRDLAETSNIIWSKELTSF